MNDGFTLYGKSNCPLCDESKSLLEEVMAHYKYVNCDEYIKENRMYFLEIMKRMAGRDIRQYPVIFKNGKYWGDSNDMYNYVSSQL